MSAVIEQEVYQLSPHLSESEQNEADEIARNSPFVPESREDSASPSSSLSASHPESPRHAVTANPDSPPSYSGLGFPTRRGEHESLAAVAFWLCLICYAPDFFLRSPIGLFWSSLSW